MVNSYTRKNHTKHNIRKNHTKTKKIRKIRKIKKLKITVDTDFYTFINKKWLDHHKYIPENNNVTNSFTLLQNKVDAEIQNILFKKVFKETTPTANRTKNLFEAASHWNNALVEKQINDRIFNLNQYRKAGNQNAMYEMLAWSMKTGFAFPFYFYFNQDTKNPKKYTTYIQESGLSFYSKEFYYKNNHAANQSRKMYLLYLNTLFIQAFGKNHCFNVEHILNVEKELVNYTFSKKQPVEKLYNKYSDQSLKRHFHFDWDHFAKLIGFKNVPKELIVINIKYFKNCMHILNKSWASDEWYAYWVYQILLIFSKFHSQLNAVTFGFFNTFLNGTKKQQSLTKQGFYFVEQIMNTEINKLYFKHYKYPDEIEYTKNLIERIVNSFKTNFTQNKWLSKKTIDKALLKLDTLKIIVGYKTQWQSDPTCDFKSNDSFGNYELYLQWHMNDSIQKYLHPVPSSDIFLKGNDLNTYDVNATYNNLKNEIIVPNAILQPPFINLKKSMAYNMANIGIIIGHEIMHAFDDEGCKYNEKGAYENWWTHEDTKIYKKRQSEIAKMYLSMAKDDNIKIDVHLTMGENLADIGGFLNVEQAFIDYLTDNKIFGVQFDEQLKDFYTYYAKEWRSTMRSKFITSRMIYDPHSLAKYRVNSSIKFSQHFHRVFNIENNINNTMKSLF
jgi:putative endopeptidase